MIVWVARHTSRDHLLLLYLGNNISRIVSTDLLECSCWLKREKFYYRLICCGGGGEYLLALNFAVRSRLETRPLDWDCSRKLFLKKLPGVGGENQYRSEWEIGRLTIRPILSLLRQRCWQSFRTEESTYDHDDRRCINDDEAKNAAPASILSFTNQARRLSVLAPTSLRSCRPSLYWGNIQVRNRSFSWSVFVFSIQVIKKVDQLVVVSFLLPIFPLPPILHHGSSFPLKPDLPVMPLGVISA